MIRSISNSPNFGSSIVFNKTLYQGFNKAIIEARKGNNATPNEFANAVNYIKNDGQNDVFTLETRNSGYESKSRCYLLKNGKTIANDDCGSIGESVMFLVTDYAENKSGKSMYYPSTEVSAESISRTVNSIQKDLTKLNDKVGNIETIAPKVSHAKKAMNNILKELNTKKTKNILAANESKSVVCKLNNIMADKHFGEMI